MTRVRQSVTHLPVDVLTAHPDNIRTNLGDVTDLARSIVEHGILQPLTATELAGHRYLLLAGHRRLAAAQRAGLATVPVIIRHSLGEDGAEHLVVMLVENVQRRDLTPIEKAEALGALRNRGLTNAEISRRTGINQANVSSLLLLLELDDESREDVRAGAINSGDAIAAVREARKAERAGAGRAPRGRPRIIEPHHFGAAHPLFAYAQAACDHTTRPKVANGACGECWETVIRADALGLPMPDPVFDEAVVQRVLDGLSVPHASASDRVEIVRRWSSTGRSLADLARQTGWKPERYRLPEHQSHQEAS